MRFVITFLLIILLSAAASLYLPWWCIACTAALACFATGIRPWASFLAGFAALFILWGGLAWYISDQNDHLLARKLSVVILQSGEPAKLILVTALVGALVGAFAALSGSLLRVITRPRS